MRRKIMTAFVCAIMTISVIPVYADDTQTDQAVTTEVSTETAATVQETKRTQRKEQQKKRRGGGGGGGGGELLNLK